jgi:hypothetical protein
MTVRRYHGRLRFLFSSLPSDLTRPFYRGSKVVKRCRDRISSDIAAYNLERFVGAPAEGAGLLLCNMLDVVDHWR